MSSPRADRATLDAVARDLAERLRSPFGRYFPGRGPLARSLSQPD